MGILLKRYRSTQQAGIELFLRYVGYLPLRNSRAMANGPLLDVESYTAGLASDDPRWSALVQKELRGGHGRESLERVTSEELIPKPIYTAENASPSKKVPPSSSSLEASMSSSEPQNSGQCVNISSTFYLLMSTAIVQLTICKGN